MLTEPDIAACKAAIVSTFPELAGARFRSLAPGWHSTAIEADGRLVFKFPRNEEAEAALLRETGLLAVIRPAVTMPVPDIHVYPGPPIFSRHTKLHGEHLVSAQYAALPETNRQELSCRIAQFYAELHSLDAGKMASAGALPINPWLTPDVIARDALPLLPDNMRAHAGRVLARFSALPSDPHGTTYGFFDGHGWNMAFDHAEGRLNGIYDFADSGFGPLHQEFIYTNFISPELTERIVTAYETMTGRHLDRERIALLTTVHRLSELAEVAGQPEHVPEMIRHVVQWMEEASFE